MKPIRLLIADIDGTLLTSEKVLSARASEAVAKLRAAGILFALTSGRPPRGMAMVTGPLKISTPVAAFNGGMIVKPDLTEVIEQKTLSLAVATEVLDFLDESGLDAWVYRGTDWFLRKPDAFRVDRERSNVHFEPVVIPDLHTVLDGTIKIVGVGSDPARVARCEAELRRRVGAYASAARSTPYYLDVTHPDANKGMVVRLASLHMKVPLEEIAVIGDMPNDVLMFGVAGTSIAMGNASTEVKRAARHVTTSNDEEGFANAVENFILARPRTAPPTLGLPPMTRACLFDLDGVLTQTNRLHAVAWKQTFDRFLQEWGQPFVPFDAITDYLLYVGGRLAVDGALSFLASRNIVPTDALVADLLRQKDQELTELLRTEPVEPYRGSVRFVEAARKAGLRTAVVSPSRHCSEVLAASGIGELFDAQIDGLVAAEEHLAGQPAPDALLAAARALGVAPAQSAVFEDELSGVAAGRAGHFGYVVGVDRAGRAAELRMHGADVVVDDLAVLLQ
jgi:Cof subfamily protein (haloacid dehalogenase superfamily)/HAD superfamily hydrolase (TIGR01509 family)